MSKILKSYSTYLSDTGAIFVYAKNAVIPQDLALFFGGIPTQSESGMRFFACAKNAIELAEASQGLSLSFSR